MLGPLTISVDGRPLVWKFEMFSASRARSYEFTVGKNERHDVVIQNIRNRVLGGFQPQECTIFVDGQQVGRVKG